MKLKDRLLLLVGLREALEKGLLSLGTYMELCGILIQVIDPNDEGDNHKE